jgi:PAS domain S-box-containing protein
VYQAADGRIIDANPAAERILGLSLDEMMGRSSIDPRWKSTREDGSVLPGEEHFSMVALRTGKPCAGIMGVFNPRTDTQRWLSITSVPEFHPGEAKPFQVFATFEDVTSLYDPGKQGKKPRRAAKGKKS